MKVFTIVFLLTSALCFFLATFNVRSKFNLVALGLCLWVVTILVPLINTH